MPYIKQGDRKFLNKNHQPTDAGELNYLITKLVLDYVHAYEEPSYGAWNEVIGVLECAKQELYRRHVGPYEERKRLENGDVYPEREVVPYA